MIHTPGPWRLEMGALSGTLIIAERHGLIAEVGPLPDARADARLIAAAPDLLAQVCKSLKWAEGMLYRLPVKSDPTDRQALETWRDGLQAAIANATGAETIGPEAGWCKEHEKEHFLNPDGSCQESGGSA